MVTVTVYEQNSEVNIIDMLCEQNAKGNTAGSVLVREYNRHVYRSKVMKRMWLIVCLGAKLWGYS
jgi:hypothetical protein